MSDLPLLALAPAGGGAPRAVVLTLHGVNDHAAVFADAAMLWASHGIATYAYDQRGFGATAGRGEWPGVGSLVEDAHRALQETGRRHPGVPLFLVGHSMGAAVVVLAAAGVTVEAAKGATPAVAEGGGHPGLSGVALLAPAVWSRDAMPAVQRAALAAANRMVPRLRLGGGLVRRPASDNRAALRASRRDPLVIQRPRVAVLAGLADLMDHAQHAAPAVRGRVLVCYGLHDLVVPGHAVVEFWSRLASAPAWRRQRRLAVYGDGWHWLHRDLYAARVLEDVAAWTRDPDAPLPSGSDRGAVDRLGAAR